MPSVADGSDRQPLSISPEVEADSTASAPAHQHPTTINDVINDAIDEWENMPGPKRGIGTHILYRLAGYGLVLRHTDTVF